MANKSLIHQWVNFKEIDEALPCLFCFPFAGSGANYFQKWAVHFNGLCNVLALRLPGRESLIQTEACADYEVIIDSIVENILTKMGVNNFFFGYSLGALMAYDVAIKCNKKQISQLFVAGMSAPQCVNPLQYYNKFSDRELLDLFKQDKTSLIATNPETEGIHKLLLPTIRIDHQLYEDYCLLTQSILAIPIHVFYGTLDFEHSEDKILAWKERTSNQVDFYAYNAQHMFINRYYMDVIDIIKAKIGD